MYLIFRTFVHPEFMYTLANHVIFLFHISVLISTGKKVIVMVTN